MQRGDRRSAWEMNSNGSYIQRTPSSGDDPSSYQEQLFGLAVRRAKDTERLLHRKSKGNGGRNMR